MSAHVLADLFARIQPGKPVQLGGITLVPLLGTDAGPDADLLEEGIALGLTTVTEVGGDPALRLTTVGLVPDGGVVGRLRVEHRGQRALLLVDGEHIQGGKQNRIFNSSMVVPAGTAVTVPVSCVEHGRWHRRGAHTASEATLNGASRSAKLRRVTRSVREGRGLDADQRAVWQDVDCYLLRTDTTSDTDAFWDGFSRVREVTEPRVRDLRPEPGQIGIAAVQDGALVSMDVFACPSLYARGYAKIARGLLAEVHASPTPTDGAVEVVERTIGALRGARDEDARTALTPGCGPTLHGQVQDVVFGAATYQGAVYHVMVSAA